MENLSENDNFNELLAMKTVTGKRYSKIKILNKDILNILLEQEGGNDREIEVEEKLQTNLIYDIEQIYFR